MTTTSCAVVSAAALHATRRWCSVLAAASVLAATSAAQAQGDAAQPSITLGETLSGSFSTSDAVEPGRGYADSYTFSGTAGMSVRISLTSDDVDTYLILKSPDGTNFAQDDDGGQGLNSLLLVALPSTGDYTIVATTFSSDSEGAYQLSVNEHVMRPIVPTPVVLGGATTGRLDDSDPTLAGRGYVDGYTLQLAVGTELEVLMTSHDFDTFLHLVGPSGERVAFDDDGAGAGTNSRLRYAAEYSGEYLVLATSFGAASTGVYEIRFSEGFGSSVEGTPITVGEPVTGSLAGEAEAGREQNYTFQLNVGQQLTATLVADEFDAYLTLLGPDGVILASDDDSAGALNSRIIAVARQSGTHALVPSSYDGAPGEFVLTTEVSQPAPVVPTVVSVDAPVRGRLDASSMRGIYDEGRLNVYHFDGVAGQEVDIDTEADGGLGLDIRVFSPAGEQFGFGNALGQFGTGVYNLGLPYTGRYTVVVAGYGTDPVDYSLSVRTARSVAQELTPIALGESVSGTLGPDSGTSSRGAYADFYRFEVERPGVVRITMHSDEIDGYLELQSADGVTIAENDDTEGFNPALRQFLPAGEYTIVATEYARTGGPYTLRVAAVPYVPLVVDAVSIGETVIGRLDETDAASGDRGTPADFYRIELGAGQQLTVSMVSEEIDTYLIALDPVGAVAAENDDADDLNARVTFAAPVAGLYTIVATGYDGRFGEYRLTIIEGALDGPIAPEH